jgi:glycosyltransferase involved in cell wall biosynthesis
MTTRTLSVVIPAYNAEASIGATLRALYRSLEHAPSFDPEIVVVDDGSADGTADAATSVQADSVPLEVLSQPNRGRFEARRVGIAHARGDWTLLLDSRVTVDPSALAFAAQRLEHDEDVWNAHVRIHDGGNPLAAFWRLLGELAWADYTENPRTTSFGLEDFDRYPKGTTCFLAPTALLREGMESFRSRYADPRMANDDTPLIRWIAARRRIHISPSFACDYEPRTSLAAFARHSVHRGVVFLDGHGRPESRFFPAVVGFYPLSAVFAAAALRRPRLVPLAVLGVAGAAASLGLARRRSAFEIATLAAVTPLYAAGHAAGMWKGLGHLLRRGEAG